MSALSETAFLATIRTPMRSLRMGERPPTVVPLGEYVRSHGLVEEPFEISHVFVSADDSYTHVVIKPSDGPHIAIVVDNVASTIAGHRTLDLPARYGVDLA